MKKCTKTTMFLTILLLVSLIALGCSSSSTTESASGESSPDSDDNSQIEPITLDAVSFLPKGDPLNITLEKWIEDVDENTDGMVKIDWKGGADIIPVGEQFEALNSGVIDINFGHIGMSQTQVPESLALALSQINPWEERENGFYEYMGERYENVNAMYLGRWLVGPPRIWLNEPISSIDELQNMKIRSTHNYSRFFDALGIDSALIDPADVYTSLQTGVVEGFVYGGMLGIKENGWEEVAPYVLDHPFWEQNATILMNNDKWNSIPEEYQQIIIDTTEEYERYMVEYYTDATEKEIETLKEQGVEFITFDSQEDADKFLEMAYEVEWEYLEEEVPEQVEEIRRLTTE